MIRKARPISGTRTRTSESGSWFKSCYWSRYWSRSGSWSGSWSEAGAESKFWFWKGYI
jgi:hypothetical protein